MSEEKASERAANGDVTDLMARDCWSSFQESAFGCIAELFGRDLGLVSPRPPELVAQLASTVTLSLPQKNVELGIVVEIARARLEAVGLAFLGADFAEGLADIVGEVAIGSRTVSSRPRALRLGSAASAALQRTVFRPGVSAGRETGVERSTPTVGNPTVPVLIDDTVDR